MRRTSGPAPLLLRETYAYTIDESCALDHVMALCLTEIADALIDANHPTLDRETALCFVRLAGYDEEGFWALWVDAQ